jgi:hypothetical protein
MSTHEKDSLRQRSPHANRIRLGKLLEKYDGRILGDIRMTIDKSSGVPSRHKYAFVKLEDEPGIIAKYPRYRPPGWEKVIEAEELNRQKEQEAKCRQNDAASNTEECVPWQGVGEKGADSECGASHNHAENYAPSRSAEAPVEFAPNLQKNDVWKGELPNTTARFDQKLGRGSARLQTRRFPFRRRSFAIGKTESDGSLRSRRSPRSVFLPNKCRRKMRTLSSGLWWRRVFLLSIATGFLALRPCSLANSAQNVIPTEAEHPRHCPSSSLL